MRRSAVALLVLAVIGGAWLWGRSLSQVAPVADEQAVARYHEATQGWLGAEEQLLVSIGHALEVLKPSEGNAQLATHPAVEEVKALLADPLPTVPPEVKRLSQYRENGDPTGDIPQSAIESLIVTARGRPTVDLEADTARVIEATRVALERTRAIGRRTQVLERVVSSGQ